MDVIVPARSADHPGAGPVVVGTIVATLLVVGGVVLAYVSLATPLLSTLMPTGRADAGQLIVGGVLWAIALVAPAAFVLLGTNRLARILGAARDRMPKPSTVMRALADDGDDIVLASGLTLPDGRGVPELVIGPFGVAVIRELPPAAVTRDRAGHWELRTNRGWVPLEHPLERTARDAERVRRWLAHDDADFVVKTYAAVVGPDPSITRTAQCAVVTPEQLATWIAALPPQRSLTPGRREQILDTIRLAAG
jgi:hypothetical protein